jgi:hypothetical protein
MISADGLMKRIIVLISRTLFDTQKWIFFGNPRLTGGGSRKQRE